MNEDTVDMLNSLIRQIESGRLSVIAVDEQSHKDIIRPSGQVDYRISFEVKELPSE